MLRAILSTALVLALSSLPVAAGPVTLLSRADPEEPSETAGGTSEVGGISSDGRYTVIVTNADNFLPSVDDTNAGRDVFLHDRVAGTTVLVSHAVGDSTTAADGDSGQTDISADGRWVTFQSTAANLVAGQVEAAGPDIFLWDRDTGTTVLVSHLPGLTSQEVGDCFGAPVISSDGGRIAFSSTAPDVVTGQTDDSSSSDLFLYDRTATTNVLVSHASGSTTTAAGGVVSFAINSNGNWVAFDSSATNLVASQVDGNGESDVFLYDRAGNTNALVSHAAGVAATAGDNRSFGPRISADGVRVAYVSVATNLMAGQVDINKDNDVFLFDRTAGTSTLVSHTLASATQSGNFFSEEPDLSTDGRYVSYTSPATDLVSASTGGGLMVFQYDHNTGTNTIVSRGGSTPTGDAFRSRISSDGAWVAFVSDATNLVAGQTDVAFTWDVFLWSRASGTLTLVTHAQGSPTEAVGVDPAGLEISADGNWIALATLSEELVDVDDFNAARDVFLYGRVSGTNTLLTPRGGAISAAAGGGIPNLTNSVMSNDGRYVAFTSTAPNVLPDLEDENQEGDIFLYDRVTGVTTLVSHASGALTTTANGESGEPLVSADGTTVVFISTASNLVAGQPTPAFPTSHVYLYDRRTGEIVLVSRAAGTPSTPANGETSGGHAVSGDGRWVAFESFGTNLVAGQADANGTGDVFLFDRTTGTTVVVSRATASATQTGDAFSRAPSISSDGRFVAFSSSSSNLAPGGTGGTFVYDRTTATNTRVTNSEEVPAKISGDGRWVAFVSSSATVVAGQVDTNNAPDVFLWDRTTGTTVLASRTTASATTAGNAVSTLGASASSPPVLSVDGRWLVFVSEAMNLVAGQSGSDAVFLFDRVGGTVTLVSRSSTSATTVGNLDSIEPAISLDGHFVTYLSRATNLVTGQVDTNESYDVFLYERATGITSLVSHILSSDVTTGAAVASDSTAPRISADGAWVAFQSASPDLVADDHDGAGDAFLYANILPGRDFYTVSPCRIIDTRQAGQGPILSTGVKRTVLIHGVCSIPVTARAVAVNATVFTPSASGNLSFYAGDLSPSGTSTINFPAGETRANNAILPLAFDGTGTVAVTPTIASSGTVHLILDVSGYFE